MSLLSIVLATLASHVATTPVDRVCNVHQINFLVRNDVTGNYGALGDPCSGSGCYLFFTGPHGGIDSSFSINSNGHWIVNSDPGHPDAPGHIAYLYASGGIGQVGFASPRYLQDTHDEDRKLYCSVVGVDNTCTLECRVKYQGVHYSGFSIDTQNDNELFIGQPQLTPVQVAITHKVPS